MAEIGRDIDKAVALLENGDLVGIPTETVYGLAGNALSEDAILQIYKAKDRPAFNPLIAHVGTIPSAEAIATKVPTLASEMMDALWPGPLTFLLPKSVKVPDLLTSGQASVAVRMPDNPLTLQLLRALTFPIAAPSANPFGYVSPTTPGHVDQQLGEKIPYILDDGPSRVGIESTIIEIVEKHIHVHRIGGMGLEKLREFGPVTLNINQSSDPRTPGQLKSHYAPGKPVEIGDIGRLLKQHRNLRTGVISFRKSYDTAEKCICLSPDGDIDEAARGLFSALRQMDTSELDIILTEQFPPEGLGLAINDRLRRAASLK